MRTGRVVYFDPWLLKDMGLITGLIFLMLGVRGSGKTSLLIELITELIARQAGIDKKTGYPNEMNVRITTRKANMGNEDDEELDEDDENSEAEFKATNDFLYGNFVDINQQGFINIFDPKMGMSEWDLLETGVNVCELANNEVPLINFQPLALQVGVHKMLTQFSAIASPEVLEVATRTLTMYDLENYFFRSNSEVLGTFDKVLAQQPELKAQLGVTMNKPHNVPKQEFLHDAGFVSAQMGRVLRGDFGHVFGGTNSLHDILSDTVTTLNMTGLNSKARTLVESMLWKWNTIAMTRKDYGLIPGINIGDEEHEGAESLMYMRYWAQNVAKARAYRTADFRATQYRKQLTEAGSEGSEIRAKANQINTGIGAHFIGRMADIDSAVEDLSGFGVAEHDIMNTVDYGPGQFGFLIPGQPIFPFQALLTPTQFELARSDQATESMMEFMPVMSFEHIQERERQVGFVQLGVDSE